MSESQSISDQQVLAARLKEAREFLGLSQEEVAVRLRIPRASMSALESAKRKVSSLELRDLAQLYRVSIDHLLGTVGGDKEPLVDESARSLYRATKDLTSEERDRVVQFAKFLRTAGRAPAPSDTGD